MVSYMFYENEKQETTEIGPYSIVFKELAKCGGGSGGIRQLYDSTKLSKYNRSTYVFSANLFFIEDFDDDVQVDLSVAVFGNGGWRSNYHQMLLDKICTYLKTMLPTTSAEFFRAMGTKGCPFPAVRPLSSVRVRRDLDRKVWIPSIPHIMFYTVHLSSSSDLEHGPVGMDASPAYVSLWGATFLYAVLLADSQALYTNRFAGPYEIVVKEVGKCGGGNTGIKQLYDSTRISKFNRTMYVFSANIIFTEEFDDKIQLELSVAVFGNGGWKSNYYQMHLDKLCSGMKNMSPICSRQFFQALGHEDCPFPAGNYTLKDYPVAIKVDLPVLPYNKYRVDGYLKRGGKRFGCYRVYMDIIPKKKN
ncbi:hypothetical protein AAG570_003174 [Ranatra chinensis]|uniref:MD-2-related lipid-recognition domain-containing protein n=1 Tax=Ranatra chinensis TaxID=642074 RepID=A0ABD0YNY0_9HEMI